MNENPTKVERRKNFLITLAYGLVLIALASFLCRYALTTLLPFLIAWVVAAILHMVLKRFRGKKHFPRKPVGIALIVLFYLAIAFLGVILCDRVLDAAIGFLTSVPQLWSNTLTPALRLAGEKITELFAHFDVELHWSVNELVASAGKAVTSYSTQLLGKIGNFAISIPGVLVDTIICIVSTVYILLDWEKIRDFIYRQLPQRTSDVISSASSQLGKTLWQYIRSYGLIMLITFVELSLGLWLTGIPKPFLIGALIAVFDILPIVGSGTVLLPWTIISFIQGNIHNGICILLLYIVVTIVRNIIEPKIVGQQVGLHPLITLLSMVLGASIFGGIGVLCLPVAVAVAKQLNDDGVIHIIKKEPKPAG